MPGVEGFAALSDSKTVGTVADALDLGSQIVSTRSRAIA